MQATPIRIGTRGSPLALAQAHEVRDKLAEAHGLEEDAFEIVVIQTTGDQVTDRPLADIGGKGLFTKEIEEALFARRIDLAVHSMKDVQTVLPQGLEIAAVLEREDVRDAFISLKYSSFDDLPEGAIVGTSSLRRQAQVNKRRPDLKVIGFRGNVQTRLRKLEEGQAEATFLACAGLKRLGLETVITSAVDTEIMLPAIAQAAIGVEVRVDDKAALGLVGALNDSASATAIVAERAFLKILDGSCRTPIAGLGQVNNGVFSFRGEVLAPDGSKSLETHRTGPAENSIHLAEDAARELLSRGAQALMGPETLVLTIQNGLGSAAKVAHALGPERVVSRVPVHGSGGSGGRKRRGPISDAAYGTPRKEVTPPDSLPRIRPYRVSTSEFTTVPSRGRTPP